MPPAVLKMRSLKRSKPGDGLLDVMAGDVVCVAKGALADEVEEQGSGDAALLARAVDGAVFLHGHQRQQLRWSFC